MPEIGGRTNERVGKRQEGSELQTLEVKKECNMCFRDEVSEKILIKLDREKNEFPKCRTAEI